MALFILPGRAYLILVGENPSLEKRLQRAGERIGFRLLKANNPQELTEISSKAKKIIGLVVGATTGMEIPAALRDKLIGNKGAIKDAAEEREVVAQLMERIQKLLPAKLARLVENAAVSVATHFLGNEFKDVQANTDFELRFTNLITCDTSAIGFFAKALCEVNFAGLRQSHVEFKDKTDAQLIDIFGEICNQVLGTINFALRPLGLDPMIALPIGVEMSDDGIVAQVDFMPMLRFKDKKNNVAIGVAIQVDKNCQANWENLLTEASTGSLEFF